MDTGKPPILVGADFAQGAPCGGVLAALPARSEEGQRLRRSVRTGVRNSPRFSCASSRMTVHIDFACRCFKKPATAGSEKVTRTSNKPMTEQASEQVNQRATQHIGARNGPIPQQNAVEREASHTLLSSSPQFNWRSNANQLKRILTAVGTKQQKCTVTAG